MHAQGCAGTRPACRRAGAWRLPGLPASGRLCVEYFAPALSDASGTADGVSNGGALTYRLRTNNAWAYVSRLTGRCAVAAISCVDSK
ncbi:hypothetical protein XACJK4_1940023 [Xanthomonas citri pv. citri]|nr:hypothetical protein XAC9322_530352 [Xanthomonas citri pv. citri]CEE33815.1 hypothetical protein XAC3824_690151 [Xanthomonas citri pv. citri]CEE46371.1 hypothetical protein XAC2911_610174 [Xanthomonas citri pv. citri]CEE47683.1 hypothetical protein XAC908_780121 [Xanthomonas citri pv. citri]CEE50701.1 hypothetical protein XACS584_1000173 [Xanthomonas citri pv. citri]